MDKVIIQIKYDEETKKLKTSFDIATPPNLLCKYLAQAIISICSQSEVKEENKPKIYTPNINIPIKIK